MLNYYQKEIIRLGPVSEFKEIVSMLQFAGYVTNDPVQPDTLRLTYPSQFIPVDSKYTKEVVPIFQVSKMVLEARYFEKDAGVYKIYHCLEFINYYDEPIPPFVCGFVDHKSKELQRWRAI